MKIEADFRVLVVEDEALISMLIEDMLSDIGCQRIVAAATVEAALAAIDRSPPAFAMLDINLNGKRSFPVADELISRRIPFVFLSGYGSRGLDGAYQDVKTLQKPFQIDDLEGALDEMFAIRVG